MNQRRGASPILLVLLVSCLAAVTGCGTLDHTYYAVEMDGALVGYTEVETTAGDPEAGTPALRGTDTRIRLSLLGKGVDLRFKERIEKDAATGLIVGYDADITTGEMKVGATVAIHGREVDYRPKGGGLDKRMTVDDDVVFTDNMTFPYLIRDFAAGDRDSAAYRVFDWVTGDVQDVDVRLTGADTLAAAGRSHPCLVFRIHNHDNGMRGVFWVDRATAELVRVERGDGVVMYLADSGVRRRVQRIDVDDLIFIDANEDIENVQDIAYMKVRARIRAPGRTITPASLNRPGQVFEGTVEDNLVDGVFTVEHRTFDGHGAPPFPRDPGESEGLRRYLEPEMTIESDDPVLEAKARELTAGAVDSWIAAGLIARWVGEEIGYDVPGGSARQTYDTRKGECGAHSRLMVALCRAAGIPARFVMGCMYAHTDGPIFGQHAWVEIHMGEAGWIPLDPTAREYTFIDSGHIRLGELVGFHPEAMEILDYRLADRDPAPSAGEAVTEWDVDRLVDANGTRLHLRAAGSGRPPVVILPGFGVPAEDWEPLAADLADETQVVLYDRAGYAQSDPGPLPRTLRGCTGELAAALDAAGVTGPYVLVGHSLGGLLARVFAEDHPGRVAGLVLLDPPPVPFVLGERFSGLRAMADELTRDLSRQAAAAREAGETEDALALETLASEHGMMFGRGDDEVRALGDLGDIPLVVIASGAPNPSFGEVADEFQRFWIEENRKLAALSTRGRFVLAVESTHALNHDAPGAVLDAIRGVLEEAGRSARAR